MQWHCSNKSFSYPTYNEHLSISLSLSLFLTLLGQESIGIQPVPCLQFTIEAYRAGVHTSMELLKNFSRNFTDEQLTTALLGITAATCCIICLMVLVVLSVYARCYSRSKVCGTVIKRLAVGLIVSTMLYQCVLALHLVHYFYPEIKDLCEFEGFQAQYFVSVQLLLTLEICLILFLEVLKQTTSCKLECYEKVKVSTFTCCKRKINKLEVAIFALAFIFPLLFDWIPFTTNSYGPSGDFCWFRDRNCSQPSCTTELWEQIWLLTVPLGLVVVLILLLFTASLCLLGYKIKKARVDRKALIEVGATNLIIFIAFLIIAATLLPIPFALGTQLFIAIFGPPISMLVPLTLLVAIHLPFSSMIAQLCLKRLQHCHTPGECDQATLHESSNWKQPSHTTWTPSHEPSQLAPFIECEQQQNYGTVHGKNVTS